MTSEGNRYLSRFMNQAVMAGVERFGSAYIHGEPFPSVGARQIPQGGAAACTASQAEPE